MGCCKLSIYMYLLSTNSPIVITHCRQFNEMASGRFYNTSSPSPYSPSPTRRSLSPSPALLATSGTTVGFTPPSPLRGRTHSFGSNAVQTHSHHQMHSTSTTALPNRTGAPHNSQQVSLTTVCVSVIYIF